MPSKAIQRSLLAATLLLSCGLPAHGQQTVSDDMTGVSSSYSWVPFGRACLTAGNGTGPIPACGKAAGGATGTIPDTPGNGALRLTDPVTNQNGAVISKTPFPSNQGVQITFKTVTYDGSAGSGADGMAFFLIDGTPPRPMPTAIGSVGGGLGYACSNNSSFGTSGISGGYLGVGIDEYGNFSFKGNGTTSTPGNTASGTGFLPSAIVLRGAGSITWADLNQNYPAAYPSSLSSAAQIAAVTSTCLNGKVAGTSTPIADYNFIKNAPLALGGTISTHTALRGSAKPITYSLTITPAGMLSLNYSYNGGATQTVISNTSISATNGPMPSYFRFGFSGSTGGQTDIHEIMCFKAAPFTQSSSSAGANIQQGQQVQTGTQLFSATFKTGDWTGSVRAQNLLYSATIGAVTVSPTLNWDAACALTGGACQATGATTTAPGSSGRQLLTWNATAGIPFEWASLTATQQAALTSGDAAPSAARLNYLRGDQSNEQTGLFRTRTSLVGDIIDSGPTPVGAPALPYAGPWSDLLHPTQIAPEGTSYAAFQSANATRLNVVYTGANDGFLHGFRAGSYDASGNFVSSTATPNDGAEVLGYMPGLVLGMIHSTTAALDLSAPQYGHNDYVDAVPGSGDLYYGGAWHTWLVGGLGVGGNAAGPVVSPSGTAVGALYALDVTTPSNFSEANAASLVIGEWTSATIACANTATSCGANLGSLTGTPIIRRLHNGQWAVIFGNGLNSSSGKAGVFIMTIDQSTGAPTFRYLDTGVGATTAGAKNGIANVASVDLDGDHVTDYLYAGDLLGNLWRFDLTSTDPANWAASPTALFSTGGLPITASAVALPVAQQVGNPRVLVSFGTGQALPQTQTSAVTYASGTQKFYGIWDWDMTAWNALSSTHYASLTAPQTIGSSNLQSQTFTAVPATASTVAGRSMSSNPICWQGSTACTANNNQFGWSVALSTAEQLIYNPKLQLGAIAFNTTIPATSQLLDCITTMPSGYTMALNPATGGATSQSFFPNSGSNAFSSSSTFVNGLALGATGTPYLVTGGAQGTPFLVQQTTSGQPVAQLVNRFANAVGNRLTWINLR